MSRNTFLLILFSVFFLGGCRQNNPPLPPQNSKPDFPNTPPLSPDEQYPGLFEAVQLSQVFADDQTFANAIPKEDPAIVLKKYSAEVGNYGFEIERFVLSHFDLPEKSDPVVNNERSRSPVEYIEAFWPSLIRPADTLAPGTLLPLPKPYVVANEQMHELSYHNAYFTLLGVQASGRTELVKSTVEDFAYLLDCYGHIPASTRSYCLSRSGPPYFSLMVELLDSQTKDLMLRQLEREYGFWMEGADRLTEQNPTHRRVVRLPDGALLNRYWDEQDRPRPEAYRSDLHTAKAAPERAPEAVYRDLRAAAESGWEFSSRWNAHQGLSSLHTTDLLPVDLNCLLWHLETSLAEAWKQRKDSSQSAFYAGRAQARAKALRQLFFEAKTGWFYDYDWKKKSRSQVYSLAGMFPLFLKLADFAQAKACARRLEKTFLRPGGLVTSPYPSGQVWDAPYGWAPLQWISIVGLRNYGRTALANTVKKRWLALNVQVYQRSGKLLEKYDVENLNAENAGQHDPQPNGCGWTHGVLLHLWKEK